MTRSTLRSSVVFVALAAAALGQEARLAYRDFGVVERMRVICSRKHFGRIHDLVVAIPSGRVTGAVVSMFDEDKNEQSLVVPWGKLSYDAQSGLLRLGTCLEHDHDFPEFDPSAVGIGVGDDGQLAGSTLVSRLARSDVALTGDGAGKAHAATIELTSGHVAFVDVATAQEGVGDDGLHPVPWSKLRFALDDADDAGTPLLTLPLDVASLNEAPTLIEIIVQDPRYRALVYKHFGVARPPFDKEASNAER